MSDACTETPGKTRKSNIKPSSAASIAGLRELIESGLVNRSNMAVVTVAGHSKKIPGSLKKSLERPITEQKFG